MRRLALFARHPEIGKVKTRLSPALPPAAACTLYRGMLADAMEAVRGSRPAQERFVYWAEAGHANDAGRMTLLAEVSQANDAGLKTPRVGDISERAQAGGDLGERLAAAFDELLATPADRAVILGADCPALDSRVLDEAFASLERTPVAIAPARDGGYALIGLGRSAPELFRGIEWSTDRVLEQTLARAREARLEIALMETLDDVDTAEDLCALVARAVTPGAAVGAGTREALRLLGVLPPAF